MRVCVLVSLLCVCWPGATHWLPEDHGCQDPVVVSVAEQALDQINEHRTTGDVFSLNRVYDMSYHGEAVRQHSRHDPVAVSRFSLSIEVWTTMCPVISRKPWKTCEVRRLGGVPVYGQCEASVIQRYFGHTASSLSSTVDLLNYQCTIQRVPSRAIGRVCPDCPTASSLDDPIWAETANQCLQKFNSERTGGPAFALMEITQGTMQWVVGPTHFVEFTIKEMRDDASASNGLCQGSRWETWGSPHWPNKITITVECEVYQPKPRAHGPPTLQGSVTVLPPPRLPVPSRRPPADSHCPGRRSTTLGLVHDCTAYLVWC